VPAGHGFFSEGEPADYVYILVSGSVRMSKLLSDGRRQVTGFLTDGDILGFEYRDQHSYSAEALSEVEVCRFDAEEFEALRQRFQGLEHCLLSRISADLVQAQEQMLLLGRKTPLEKLASFLLRLRKRQRALNSGSQMVRLPMTRADIADYLGLTIETVSRSFTFLRKAGVIDLPEPSLVRIRDRERLEKMAA
jgi:CRP/FNR family transcriptional regulator